MATPTNPPVTGDELLQHRLTQLEEWRVESSATLRSTERRFDVVDIEASTVKGLLVELRTEVRDRDEHTRASIARLHERLDSITTAEAREQGRELGEKTGRSETLKVIGWSVMATIAFSAVVVGLLTLLLK